MIRRRWNDWAAPNTETTVAAVEREIFADTTSFDKALFAGVFGEPFQPDAFCQWLGEPVAGGPSHPTPLFFGRPKGGEWDVFALRTLDEIRVGTIAAWARLETIRLVLDEKLEALGSKIVHPVLQETLQWSADRLDELFDVLTALGQSDARPALDEDQAQQIRQEMASIRL